MTEISGIRTRLVAATDIPTPSSGKAHFFFDISDGQPRYKDSTGTVHTLSGAVVSFNGRQGAVTPQQSDYDSFFLTPAEGDASYQHLTANVVAVKTNPSTGEFSSIRAAVNSISTASISNPFIVIVGPGVYTELPITVPSYIYVKGSGELQTIVNPVSANQNIFELKKYSSISDMFISGATGTGFCGVHYQDATSTADDTASMENIRFGANDTHAKVESSGNITFLLSTNVKFGGTFAFVHGFVATGNSARIQLRNSTTIPDTVTTASEFLLADGPNCQAICNSVQWRTGVVADPYVGSINGVVAKNGSTIRLNAANLNGFQHAIYMPNTGAATSIAAAGLNFENNDFDIWIDHASATGHIVGYSDYSKIYINTANSVFIANKDAQIITVAHKGGDFTSIAAACASITGATLTNQFVVYVGPGLYTEPLITLPNFVNLVGHSIDSTFVQPDSSNHHIVQMGFYTEISFMTFQNAGSGYAAIASIDQGNFTQVHKVSIYNCDIGIYHKSVSKDSYLYLEYVDCDAVYSNALKIESTNGFIAFCNAENFYTFPDLSNTEDDIFVTGPAAQLELQAFGLGIQGSQSSDGLKVSNGGSLTMQGGYIRNYQTGILDDLIGTGATINISGVQFANCIMNFNIQNAGTSGSYTGYTDHSKFFINQSSGFFITNKDARIITVAKKGGDFTSLSAAIASITDASTTNRYVVSVGPGIYTEPLIDLSSKPFISISGTDENSIIIEPSGAHDILWIGPDNEVSFLTLRNAASSYSAIVQTDVGLASNYSAAHKVTIIDCDNGIKITTATPGVDVNFYGEFVTIKGTFTSALLATDTGGTCACVNMVHFTVLRTVGALASSGLIVVSGPEIDFMCHAVMIEANSSDTAFVIKNGADVNISATTVKEAGLAISVPNIGTGPKLQINVVDFVNCTQNLTIVNTATTGSLIGNYIKSKISIPDACAFFIDNRDTQVITVARRGGDFTSIAAAIAAITDASSSKPYVVQVGPGIFVEPQITMKQFVSVKGVGDSQQTIIQAASTSQKIIVGADNSSLLNVTLNGATAPSGIAIYHEGSGTITPFQVKNIVFGNNYTQVSVFGNAAITILLLEASLMGGTSNQTNGIIIASNSGIMAQVAIVDLVYQDVISGFSTGDFINISGASSQLVVENLLARVGSPTGNGLVVSDGAEARLIGGISFRGFLKAIWIQNTGAPPFVSATGVHLESNTEDLRIDHPSATGTFNGDAVGSKVFNAAHDTFPLLINDLVTGSTISSGTLVIRYPGDIDTDISTLVTEASTMGNMETNLISNGGGLTVNVAEGFGYLEIEPEILRRFDWGDTSINVPANTESYIFFDSTGTLTASNTRPDSFYNILLGRVVTDASSIFIVDDTSVLAEHTSNRFDNFFRDAFGPVFSSGSATSENTTPFHLNVSSGVYYVSMNKFLPSGGNNITFLDYYRDGAGGWTIASTNVVENSTYDDGTGTPHNLSAGFYAKHSLYVVGEGANEQYFLVRSQAQYATLLLAQNGSIPTPPSYFKEGVVLIAGIIVQQGATSITNANIQDERPRIGFSPAGTSASSDHQALSNRDVLTAHSQYLLKANTDHMSVDLDMGGNSVIDVNLVDGVKVSAHEARHLPNGADPLATAAPVSIGTANSIGNANSYSVSNHVHDHGSQSTPTHHAAADGSNAGFLSAVAQTIGGIKTFNAAPILNSLTASLPLKLDASKNIVSAAIVDADVATGAAISNTKLAISAVDGVKLNTGTGAFSLDIDGLTALTFIVPTDELPIYSTADPYYLTPENRKVTFATFESHLALGNLYGKLPIAKGGTNSTTPLNNNRFIISVGGEITEAGAMTANRALLTDGAGLPQASKISEIELDSLSGISGNIQALLNVKLSNQLGNTHLFVGNSSNIATEVALSGDASLSNAGILTISNGAITDAKVSATAAIANTKLAISGTDGVKLNSGSGAFSLDIDGLTSISFISPTDELAIFSTADPYLPSDNRKVTFSNFEAHLNLSNLTGRLSIAKGGTNSSTALSNNRIMISNSGEITEASAIAANVVILSDAQGLPRSSAISETQLNALSGISGNVQALLNSKVSISLGSGHVNIGNSSNIATDTAISGDASLANTGALTISNNAVSNAKFRQSAGLSIVGNSAVGSGNVADITAAAANQVLRLNSAGNALGFGAINLASSSAVTGALPIANGGTGQVTNSAAFDALSPLNTKGDLIVYGSSNVRQSVGANGTYLAADSTATNGINWKGLDVDSQNANATAATTTTSATLVDLAGATLTTAGSFTKNYNINFTGTFSSGANNTTASIQLSINGSGITNTLRTVRVSGTAGGFFLISLNWTASIPVGQIVKIQWDTSGNTLTLQAGTLTIFGVA